MSKFVITILATYLIATSGFPNLNADTLKTNTVLYKVIHPDSEYVTYLFGTHHAFGKPFFDSLKFTTDALLSSDVLIKENLNIPGHLAEDIINQRTTITKWNKYLDQERYASVQALFSSSSLEFDKMRPAELYAFLSRHNKEQVCVGKDPAAKYFSLDDYIGMVAEQNDLAVLGLETTEEQLALINNDLSGMPRKVHKKRLERMIDRIQSASDDHCAEIQWYRTMNFDFKLDQPCKNALVLSDRNEKWLTQLQDHISSRNCSVAVGLSHLMFECGLIVQLRALGYQIVPIQVK